MDGITAVCPSAWTDWAIPCQLEVEHPGAHTGMADGRLGYWGGPVAEWTRV